MPAIRFLLVFLLLLATEGLRVYFIMPFPGSQQAETVHRVEWFRSVFVMALHLASIALLPGSLPVIR